MEVINVNKKQIEKIERIIVLNVFTIILLVAWVVIFRVLGNYRCWFGCMTDLVITVMMTILIIVTIYKDVSTVLILDGD